MFLRRIMPCSAPKYNDTANEIKNKHNLSFRNNIKKYKCAKHHTLFLDAKRLRTFRALKGIMSSKRMISPNLDKTVVDKLRSVGVRSEHMSMKQQIELLAKEGKVVHSVNYDSCSTIGGDKTRGIFPVEDLLALAEQDVDTLVLHITLSQRLKTKRLWDKSGKIPVWEIVKDTIEKGIFVAARRRIVSSIGVERYSKGDGPMLHFEYVLERDESIDSNTAEYYYHDRKRKGEKTRIWLGFAPKE